ncbi:BED zinc finger [Prunus dulcis]|uniref:BED zinc finger n=1 Tax=Prunus dulcis TaxID=3755 RepID=A0A4Y1QMN6_PRUDU|nr:BED zinc finger [Prunus dulcis]
MKTKQRLLLFLSISASPLRLPIYHKSLGNTPNYKNPKSVLEDPYSIIKTQNLCWRHLNSLRTINSFVLLLLRYLYLATYELSLILQNWIYKILPSMFKLGDKKEDSVQLKAPFKFDVPSPDDLVSNGLWSSRTGSKSSAAIFGMLASKGKQKSVISSRTEVFKYLDTEFVEFMTEEERNNFNILDWWKAHEKNFPVLSIMARDVLTTPVSTVASESAFSAGGRVLDEKRTRLTPQICEALMCLKDWEDADFRTQSFVDEDLSYFEDDSTSSLNEEREMTNADILPSVLD